MVESRFRACSIFIRWDTSNSPSQVTPAGIDGHTTGECRGSESSCQHLSLVSSHDLDIYTSIHISTSIVYLYHICIYICIPDIWIYIYIHMHIIHIPIHIYIYIHLCLRSMYVIYVFAWCHAPSLVEIMSAALTELRKKSSQACSG